VGDCRNNPGNANLPIGVFPHANREIGVPGGWHSRGYLPHFEGDEVTQHVTFHLADSLPQAVMLRLDAELKTLPAGKREAERRKRVDEWIDAGRGSCILREASIAAMVQGSLLAFDSQRYRMLAWVVDAESRACSVSADRRMDRREDRGRLEEVHGPQDLRWVAG
jgi:putative transposase